MYYGTKALADSDMLDGMQRTAAGALSTEAPNPSVAGGGSTAEPDAAADRASDRRVGQFDVTVGTGPTGGGLDTMNKPPSGVCLPLTTVMNSHCLDGVLDGLQLQLQICVHSPPAWRHPMTVPCIPSNHPPQSLRRNTTNPYRRADPGVPSASPSRDPCASSLPAPVCDSAAPPDPRCPSNASMDATFELSPSEPHRTVTSSSRRSQGAKANNSAPSRW